MAIANDIAIDASGNIYYTGAVHGAVGAGYYSVIELHRFLQDLADDATASGDDLIDITRPTPSDRSTDNIITILSGYRLAEGMGTENIAEHLYDGSITQVEDGTVWDGLVVIGPEGMDLQIMQNGALIANDFWNHSPAGMVGKGLNRDVANGYSHRFMLKVNNAGAVIDGRRIIGMTRELGKGYSEFKINGTGRGNNVIALTASNDLNNQTAPATIATYNDVAVTPGYVLLDIDNNGTSEPFYAQWTRGSRTINQLYERVKWLTACESGTTDATANGTLFGLPGNIFRGITHELTGTQAGGSFPAFGAVTWTGGTGQMLATNGATGATKLWMQLLTGVAPSSGTVTVAGGATFTVSGVIERPVSAPVAGLSTGSALIGAFGFGVTVTDLTSSDLLTTLTGASVQPPNIVTFTVSGLVANEDRVLVAPALSGAIHEAQCSLSANILANATSVTLASNGEVIGNGTASASDTPTSGTIRVLGNDGVFHRVTYTGRTMGAGTITFTGCTGTPAATAGANAYISYIDRLADATSESYTIIYPGAPRQVFVRVRDGGTAGDLAAIKTFESAATMGAAGGSTTVIRTADV